VVERPSLRHLARFGSRKLHFRVESAGFSTSAAPLHPTTFHETSEFQNVTGVEITITDMVKGSHRVQFVDSSEVFEVQEAKAPLRIRITENNSEYLKMELFSLVDGKWTVVSDTNVGKASTQILTRYGVVLNFYTHGA
ncbi:hypothetical protein, partial [Denitratimonas sp. CY0512]|uniref:hypothetical protein n=1 Tax=Denitratimonas sp. CY0512 TaxID=3131940 RepID=UPI00309912A6